MSEHKEQHSSTNAATSHVPAAQGSQIPSPPSAQGLPAPLTPLPLTSFCTILEARIFSMMLASSSGGSWGQESTALFHGLMVWLGSGTLQHRTARAPLPAHKPVEPALREWDSSCSTHFPHLGIHPGATGLQPDPGHKGWCEHGRGTALPSQPHPALHAGSSHADPQPSQLTQARGSVLAARGACAAPESC